jgi:hypothetical protein
MRSPVRNSGDVTLLIAPHSDDIAYSVGDIIAKGILRPPLVGVTVFTRSDYSMYPKFGISTAIIEGKNPTIDGREARKSLAIVLAFEESLRASKPVVLG